MNGVGVGLLLGVGLVLVLLACTDDPGRRRGRGSAGGLTTRVEDLLAAAGLAGGRAPQLLAVCAGCALVAAVLGAGLSHAFVLGVAAGAGGAWLPVALLRRRAERRRTELRALWPDVVDDLASAVRAGLALPDALAQVGAHGPPAVAPAFARFAVDYATSGRFGEALDALKDRLADPVADRIVESLRLAREVGGSDLGRLLRGLSAFLRDDARTRGELETRQGWTVNAAKLAAAAPWVTLALLALRPDAVRAYDSAAGVTVLLVGAAVTVLAYRAMLLLGRLPTEARVLR